MGERPIVTVEAKTANSVMISIRDGSSFYVGPDGVIVYANGALVEVQA